MIVQMHLASWQSMQYNAKDHCINIDYDLSQIVSEMRRELTMKYSVTRCSSTDSIWFIRFLPGASLALILG
jgi:hypothetical protein